MFDPAPLAHLRADLDATDFAEAVALYRAEGCALAAQIALAPTPADCHALKGVALALGLTDLAQAARAGEVGVANGAEIAALWQAGQARLDQEFGQ